MDKAPLSAFFSSVQNPSEYNWAHHIITNLKGTILEDEVEKANGRWYLSPAFARLLLIKAVNRDGVGVDDLVRIWELRLIAEREIEEHKLDWLELLLIVLLIITASVGLATIILLFRP